MYGETGIGVGDSTTQSSEGRISYQPRIGVPSVRVLLISEFNVINGPKIPADGLITNGLFIGEVEHVGSRGEEAIKPPKGLR